MSMYECEEYPCIHIVVDYSGKKLAAFFEDSEGEIIWIPLKKLFRAAEKARELLDSGFREAEGDEVDSLAHTYLEAEPP